jgi:hypothetical protein
MDHVAVFVFTSSTLTNIWAGLGSRKWAVSAQQAGNASIRTKARRLPVGQLGLFYCTQTKSLTASFVIATAPDMASEVSHIWPETWALPFGIVPLGTPEKQIHTKDLAVLPSVRDGTPWHKLLHFQPTTVFAPSQLSVEDWSVLASRLLEIRG